MASRTTVPGQAKSIKANTARGGTARKLRHYAPIVLISENIAEGRMVHLVEEADGGYSASVPALRGCHSQGDTLDEALLNIKEAAELYLEYAQTQKAE